MANENGGSRGGRSGDVSGRRRRGASGAARPASPPAPPQQTQPRTRNEEDGDGWMRTAAQRARATGHGVAGRAGGGNAGGNSRNSSAAQPRSRTLVQNLPHQDHPNLPPETYGPLMPGRTTETIGLRPQALLPNTALQQHRSEVVGYTLTARDYSSNYASGLLIDDNLEPVLREEARAYHATQGLPQLLGTDRAILPPTKEERRHGKKKK